MNSKKFFISFIILMTLTASAHAEITKGVTACLRESSNDSVSEKALGLALSTTTPPTATTAFIICAGVNSAEINGHMLQKEATLLNEENKIYVPSFLGAYAEKRGLSLGDAANEVLGNEAQ